MVSAMSIGAGIYLGDICHARLDELQSLKHLLTGHKLPSLHLVHTSMMTCLKLMFVAKNLKTRQKL